MPDLAPAETGMLKAFHLAKWHPTDPFVTADRLWLSLVRLLLEQNDTAAAIVVAADLHEPSSVLTLRSDKRFDPIVAANAKSFDVIAAYQASLADKRAKSSAAPDTLEGVNTLAGSLLVFDRPEEALAIATNALARYKANPSAFTDAKDQINWTYDVRARALLALGRSDEALAELAAGAKQQEHGDANVSQKINLADEYVAYNRPKDALDAVAGMEAAQASAYGAMALADARACAYFELGDTGALEKALAYMQAHAKDATNEYVNALLFTGREDAAAIELIAALRDPATRLEVVRWVQTYLPQHHPSPREQARHAAWIAVLNRRDVQKEIALVGHVHAYPLQAQPF
jgi:hypothetical protein